MKRMFSKKLYSYIINFFISETLCSFKFIHSHFFLHYWFRSILLKRNLKKKKIEIENRKTSQPLSYPCNLMRESSSNFTDNKTRIDSKIWLTIMTVSIGVCWRQTASRRYSCKSRGKFAIRLQHELGRSLPPVNSGNRAKIMLPSNSSENFDYSCSDNAISPFRVSKLLWKVQFKNIRNF